MMSTEREGVPRVKGNAGGRGRQDSHPIQRLLLLLRHGLWVQTERKLGAWVQPSPQCQSLLPGPTPSPLKKKKKILDVPINIVGVLA